MDTTPKKTQPTIIVASIVCLSFFVYIGFFGGAVTQSVVYYLGPQVVFAQESSAFTISQHLLQAIVSELQVLRRENNLLQKEIDYERTKQSITRSRPHILVVAGHTEASRGTQFGDLTEYELNYEVMQKLGDILGEDGDYEVTVSHEGGDYSDLFLEYFEEEESSILAYRDRKKRAYEKEYPQGVTTNDTDHNYASDRGVVELYGVNKWIGENDIDMVVHVHFNDYPGRKSGSQGEHTGFSVFVPLKTNNHFVESFNLAKLIEQELLKHDNRSTVKKESAGVMESELIAVGQADSVEVPAVLVEGGFIYEDRFTSSRARSGALDTIAEGIYRAIDRYFQNK